MPPLRTPLNPPLQPPGIRPWGIPHRAPPPTPQQHRRIRCPSPRPQHTLPRTPGPTPQSHHSTRHNSGSSLSLLTPQASSGGTARHQHPGFFHQPPRATADQQPPQADRPAPRFRQRTFGTQPAPPAVYRGDMEPWWVDPGQNGRHRRAAYQFENVDWAQFQSMVARSLAMSQEKALRKIRDTRHRWVTGSASSRRRLSTCTTSS